VNLYSLFVYIEHNGDESPKDYVQTASCPSPIILTTLGRSLEGPRAVQMFWRRKRSLSLLRIIP